MLKYICVIFFNFQTILGFPDTEYLGEVVFTSILYRHGDRTPIRPYPNDPYKNNSLWPAPWGELTDVGKRGQYELGKWLRYRYQALLPEKYNKDDIYIQSTDVDRTLMSAYSNLAGLYQANKETNWNPDILWSPIPVHTVPENLDSVLAGQAPCPMYEKDQKDILNSETFQKINKENKKLYDYLSQASGLNIKNVINVAELYDILLIQEKYNFKLPEWTASVYPQPMKDISGLSFSIPCYTPTSARLKIGPLFKEILKHMNEKISGTMTPDRKAWMYSAHDVTIANILQSLQMFEFHCPPYLSLILIELIKRDDNYYVAIHYRNSTSISPYLLNIPGCEKLCPFEKFKKVSYKNSTSFPPYLLEIQGCEKFCPFEKFRSIVFPLIPDDWKKECQETHFVQTILKSAASVSFITALSLSLISLVSILLILKFYTNRRWKKSDCAYTILKTDMIS